MIRSNVKVSVKMVRSSRAERGFSGTPGQLRAGYGSYVSRSGLDSRTLISSYRTRFGLEIPYERGEEVFSGGLPSRGPGVNRPLQRVNDDRRAPSRRAIRPEDSYANRSAKFSGKSQTARSVLEEKEDDPAAELDGIASRCSLLSMSC